MTQIIAISNHKGGVAKTTSCVSLGACLAEAGQRTLIVDFDPQANLTLSVGFEPEDLETTVVDLLEDSQSSPAKVEQAILPTVAKGLSLLPADQRLVTVESYPGRVAEYRSCLQRTLKLQEGRFDYILIDCPPSLGALTIMALTAANMALIPVQCDYFATRGLFNLLTMVEAVRTRTNPGLQTAVFVTMYDTRTLISRRILDQLRERLPDTLLNTIIGMDTRLRESVVANEPVTLYASRSRASSQYRNLAAEVIRRTSPAAQ